MSYHLSTKEVLLMLLDDLEIINKELLENMLVPKHQKISSAEHAALVDLLVWKHKEFRKMLQQAAEQAKIEKQMDQIRAKVETQNREIMKLYKGLKDSEQLLAKSIFEARQQLEAINLSNKRPVSSEDLIKYAYRISAAYATVAPYDWTAGDMRRPYPTDMEMCGGFLGKADLTINGVGSSAFTSLPESQRNTDMASSSFQNPINWGNPDLYVPMGSSGNTSSLDTRSHKETPQDDVEVMSTDSSSSSSSDSQ